MGVQYLEDPLELFPFYQGRCYLVDLSLSLVLLGSQFLDQLPLRHILLQQSNVLVFVNGLGFAYPFSLFLVAFQLFIELL